MDFLILYEHASRELENACLLGEELKNRGYSIRIECIYSIRRFFYRPKVLVVPHLYNNKQVVDFGSNFFGKAKKIIDLQYEQILSKSGLESNHHMPKDEAKFAFHIAWGEDQFKRYLENDIPKTNVKITGSIGMDLNHECFDNFFISRNNIAKKFGIPNDKKWRIFISSFTLCNRTEEEIKRYEVIVKTTRELKEIMTSSKKEILKWIELVLENYPEDIFIYRPHPAERTDEDLKRLEEKFSNFRVISELSIRQWVRVIDYAYTWFSTSIADFYFSNKNCEILRPYKISDEIDALLFKNAKVISTLDEFESNLKLNDSERKFPIEARKIKEFYGYWKDGKAYKRVADLCEDVYKSELAEHNFNINYTNSKMNKIKRVSMYLLYELCKDVKLSVILKNILSEKYIIEFDRAEREMYKKKKLIKFYQKKFKELV